MKDPYYIALQRAVIGAIITTGATVGTLIGSGADVRQIAAAAIVGIFGYLAVRFLGEGTIDSNKRNQREADLIIKDAADNGFMENLQGSPRRLPDPIDFDKPYHFSRDGGDRHVGNLASECAICLRGE